MNIMIRIITFTLLSFLASCQVKETASKSGLISDHRPAINSFTIQSPTSGYYVTGDVLNFVLTFPYPVTVDTTGGTPNLALTIGSSARVANYVSGTGTRSLSFHYTIVAADNDSDGVTFQSIALNGGTLTFDNQGVIENCSTTLSSTTFAGVIIDNAGPTVSGFALATLSGFYNVGEKISFTVTFNEPVYVTGAPSLLLGFTTPASSTGSAVYSGGSGSSTIQFTYTIPNDRADTNGYTINSNINLNAGTIKDSTGNDSSLDLSAFSAAVASASVNVKFDGRLPYVVSVTPPANGTYTSATNLDVTIEFDRPVAISGTTLPYINLTIGSITRQATYLSGSATNTLVFRYVTVPGDNDTDGITITPSITQNAGNITGQTAPTNSYFTQAANNVLSIPTTAGVLVDAIQPAPVSASRNTDITNPMWGTDVDNVWNIGQQLLITVSFNTNIEVIQTSGTPYLPITIGSTVRNAPYLSGGSGTGSSLVFAYTIQEGDLDTDGTIDLGSIVLNGGTITDNTNTNATLTIPTPIVTSTTIDGVRPTITSITPATSGIYSTVTGNNHLNMIFQINWSEAVNYSSTAAGGAYFTLDIGGSSVNAIYGSANNSDKILHWPASLASTNDADGITTGSTLSGSAIIKDRAGNTGEVLTFTPPDTSGIFVDTIAPTVTNVAPPANKTYTAGNKIEFVLTFSEAVSTNLNSGYPRITMLIGGTTKYLRPVTAGSSLTHAFTYDVVSGDLDTDGVTLGNSIQINGSGSVIDVALNPVSGTFSLPVTTGIIVDADPAIITGVSVPASGTYVNGDVLDIVLTYEENVTVTGTPIISTNAQTGTIDFAYVPAPVSNTVTFRYTVQAADFDFDGLTNISSINLNGGSITGANTVPASTTFTNTSLAAVFISYPGIQVWSGSDITNKAAEGTIAVTSAAAAMTEPCGNGTCRTFDGAATFELSSPYAGVRTVFIIFETLNPAANYTIAAGLDLVENTGNYDLVTSYTGRLDNILLPATGLSPGLTHVLQINFASPTNLSGSIIDPSFRGAIGEIIMIDGALTSVQLDEINNYLMAKY